VAGRLTLLELLEAFQSIRVGTVPLEVFLESMSPLQPRFYSISSSPKVHPKSLHVTAAVVKYATPHNYMHEGTLDESFRCAALS